MVTRWRSNIMHTHSHLVLNCSSCRHQFLSVIKNKWFIYFFMSVFATASWWHHVGAAVTLLLSPTVQTQDTLGKLRIVRETWCQCGNTRLPLTVALWWTGELSGVQPAFAALATTATLNAQVVIGNGWMGGCLQPINNNNNLKEEESEPNFPLLSGLFLLSVPLTNCIWEFFFHHTANACCAMAASAWL